MGRLIQARCCPWPVSTLGGACPALQPGENLNRCPRIKHAHTSTPTGKCTHNYACVYPPAHMYHVSTVSSQTHSQTCAHICTTVPCTMKPHASRQSNDCSIQTQMRRVHVKPHTCSGSQSRPLLLARPFPHKQRLRAENARGLVLSPLQPRPPGSGKPHCREGRAGAVWNTHLLSTDHTPRTRTHTGTSIRHSCEKHAAHATRGHTHPHSAAAV